MAIFGYPFIKMIAVMRKSLILFFLLIISQQLWSQQAILECLAVREIDGAVKVSYSGPNNATAYKIYRATQINGNYTHIHTATNITFLFYTDTEINAASQSYAYYVEAIVDGQSTGTSNKLRTMLLTTNNPENGLAELKWTDPGITPTEAYAIWRKAPDNNLIYIANTSNLEYTDTIEICDTTYYYQIRVETPDCISISNPRGGDFGDHTQPEIIIPENASIDIETGEIVLSWMLPSAVNEDIEQYFIWIMNENGGSDQPPIAVVDGYENLSLTLPSGQGCDTSLTYSITAIDSCGNAGVWNEAYFIRTINMHNPEYNICDDKCTISWDSIYPWFNNEVSGIRIYMSEDEEAFEVVGEVSSSEHKADIYGFERGRKYKFYIESYSEDNEHSSTSCIKYIVGKKPINTSFTLLRSASVLNGKVQLRWQIDTNAIVPEYSISRSTDGINYNIIDTILGNHYSIQTYFDRGSEYYKEPQYYTVSPFDSCYNAGEASNFARTIHASVESYEDGKALIKWTAYEYMEALSHYNIYRIIDSLVYPFPVAEIFPTEDLSIIDDYGGFVPSSSRVGYLVEAIGKVIDTLPTYDSIRSNINFLTKASNLFIPNGFNPRGDITKEFKPIYTGIRTRNYNFKILNQWGQIIFESHQPILGWNGKYEGEYVMAGAYVYVIEYETIYDKKLRKSGMFYVM